MRTPIFAAAFSIMFSSAFAVLEIPNAQPKVHAEEWKWVLDNTWAGLKRRNIDAYNSKSGGLIHRPKSEAPGDAVSEGVGYGMLLALYADDQEYFDKIYSAAGIHGLNACKNWRKRFDNGYCDNCGGPASDADEDIGLALIFADKLVQEGLWNNTSEAANYASNAQATIKCLFETQVHDWKLLKPGAWGAPPINPGYFAPAWYRIFAEFDNDENHTWNAMIDESYRFLAANPVYDLGMVPDWTGNNGEFLDDGPGYNAYLKGNAFYKDAIRILWRIANDYIWFGEPRAKTFLENSLKFINDEGGPDAANFYQLKDQNKGKLVQATDKWMQFNDSNNQDTWRYRREHSHLTVGQWLTAVMAVGSEEEKIAWSKKMAEFYDYDIDGVKQPDYFGNAIDPTGGIEDTLHNEMYFDQFLAWFGVSLMSGTWVNVIDVLDNPVANNTEGIPGSPFPEPPEPIIAKSNMPLGIQINQSAGILRLYSQSDVVWKIHNLQGKLLFNSNSKEAIWNTGNFKGAIIVTAINGSNAKQKLVAIK